MHSGATKEIARRFLHTGLLIMLIVINFFPSKSASSQVLNLTASKTSIFFPLVMSEDAGQIRVSVKTEITYSFIVASHEYVLICPVKRLS